MINSKSNRLLAGIVHMPTHMIKFSLNFFVILLTLARQGDLAAQQTAAPAPSEKPFTIDGRPHEGGDISAIERAPKGLGVMVSDEGAHIQVLNFVSPDSAEIVATIPLGGAEADFEGAAFDDKTGEFFVTGSHGVSKKKGEFQRSRFTVQRLLLHPDTPSRPTQYEATANLTEILLSDAVLGEFFGKPLQQKGLNVEGLAASDGSLFFGFRSPNMDGDAIVLEVDANALFKNPEAKYRLHRLAVGKGTGIRALSKVGGGFVVLTGNAGSSPNTKFPQSVDHVDGHGFAIFFWNPGRTVQIAKLPRSPGKAEGMLVLNETATHYDVLFVFDGPAGGAPSRFTIAKPNPAG